MFINIFGHKISQTEFKKIFASSTLIVTVGVLIGAFFGYLLQFLLARFLSVSDYGTFNALLSLTYLIGVPTSVLTASVIKVSSELLAKKSWNKITKLYLTLNLYLLLFGTLVFGLIVIFKNYISSYLNLTDTNLLIPFGLFLGFSYLLIVPGAYLQGLLRFKAYAFYTIVNAFLRMVIPISLVLLGFGVFGVFNGFWITNLIIFVVAYFLLKKNLNKSELFKYIDVKQNYKRIISFSSSVVFINFGLMALNNLDMIIVKRYFDQEIAGYYAGTVTLGKIFLFGAGTVSAVMYPQISSLFVEKSIQLYDKFKKFLYVQLFFIFGGLAFFLIFPGLLTNIFFGNRFTQSIQYLPLFSVFIALYILVNFMVLFFMAIDKTKVFALLIIASVIQYLLLETFNTSIWQVIYINIGVTSVLLITLLIYYFFSIKKIFISNN